MKNFMNAVVTMVTVLFLVISGFIVGMYRERIVEWYEYGCTLAIEEIEEKAVEETLLSKSDTYTIARSYSYAKKIEVNNWRRANGHIDQNGMFYGTSDEAFLMAYTHPGVEFPWNNEGNVWYVRYDGDAFYGVTHYSMTPSV